MHFGRSGMQDLHDHFAGQHLGIFHDLLYVLNGAAGDLGRVETPQPVFRSAFPEHTGQYLVQFAVVLGAQVVVPEPIVACQVLSPHDLAQSLPEDVVARRDHDPSVPRLDGLEGRDGRMPGSEGLRDGVRHVVPGDGVLEQGDLAVQHADVHHLPPPRLRPGKERRENADTGVEGRGDVADGHAHPDGRAVRFAGNADDAAHALDDHVVGPAPGVGPGLSEPGTGRVDQSGEPCLQRFVIQSEFLHHARPEILHQDVRLADQFEEQFAAVGMLQIDRDALLAPVDVLEVAAHALFEGAKSPRLIAAEGLDLDDIGTQVAQGHGREGTREYPGQVDDANVIECAHGSVRQNLATFVVYGEDPVLSGNAVPGEGIDHGFPDPLLVFRGQGDGRGSRAAEGRAVGAGVQGVPRDFRQSGNQVLTVGLVQAVGHALPEQGVIPRHHPAHQKAYAAQVVDRVLHGHRFREDAAGNLRIEGEFGDGHNGLEVGGHGEGLVYDRSRPLAAYGKPAEQGRNDIIGMPFQVGTDAEEFRCSQRPPGEGVGREGVGREGIGRHGARHDGDSAAAQSP